MTKILSSKSAPFHEVLVYTRVFLECIRLSQSESILAIDKSDTDRGEPNWDTKAWRKSVPEQREHLTSLFYLCSPHHKQNTIVSHWYIATLLHCYIALPNTIVSHCYIATLLHYNNVTLLHCYIALPTTSKTLSTHCCYIAFILHIPESEATSQKWSSPKCLVLFGNHV